MEWLLAIKEELTVFACSMLPILELRFSIPLGEGLGLSIWLNYIISVVGNLLPIPFILIFIRKILEWMSVSRVALFRKAADWILQRAEKHSASVQKYATWGLFLFVAIPLPGTGGWTGALIAALLGMRFKKSMVSIVAGVMTAGILVSIVTLLVAAGINGFWNFFIS